MPLTKVLTAPTCSVLGQRSLKQTRAVIQDSHSEATHINSYISYALVFLSI